MGLSTSSGRDGGARDGDCGTVALAALAVGAHARVTAIGVDDVAAPWLEAVGIAPGERLVVLRRALFGGPLHVRTAAGGEFALARSLAQAIIVSTRDDDVSETLSADGDLEAREEAAE